MKILYSPAYTWRQTYNPLIGLTLQRLVLWFNQSEQGFKSELQWAYRFFEKRDSVLKAVKDRRLSTIQKLEWAVKIKKDYTEEQASAQKAFLEDKYNTIDNMKEAIKFLALAEFRGYSHLEKHYTTDGDCYHLEPVPQWLWAQHMPSKDWLYNEKALQTSVGVQIDPNNFIIREIEDPIDEIAAICFIRKNMSQKDWDGFVETYGIPPLFIELPLNSGGGTTTETFQQMAEKVISDARGVLPNGAKMVPLTVGETGNGAPFDSHIRYQDEQIVLAGTGGLLTTLSEPTGLGSGQPDAHQDAFFDIAMAEALEISEVFQRQFDAPLLREQFPSQDAMVYFEIAFEEVETKATVIEEVAQLAAAGLSVDPEEISEKTGYKLERTMDLQGEQQSELMEQQQKMQQQQMQNRARKAKFLREVRPIKKNLERIINTSGDQFVKELVKLEEQLANK